MILKNGNVLVNNEIVKKDVLIENGKVTKIEDNIEGSDVIDCTNLLVSPGFLDVHIHLREPGFTKKETVKTGTMASAKGGYTHIFAMPNVDPVPSDLETVQVQLDIYEKDAQIKVTPYGSISKDLSGMQLSEMDELKDVVCAFTDDGLGVQSDELMEQAMIKAKSLNKLIVAHCEDNRFIESDNERSEYEQVKRDVELALKTGASYHVCHISTKESIEYVRQGKKAGANVTCEVTPHHLLLSREDVKGNTNFKMNPPLRSKEDLRACIEGILDGTIDIIATDHAPHTEEEKGQEFSLAPNGIVGVETAFGLLYKHFVTSGFMKLEDLINKMAKKPHEVFNIEGGEIKVGASADITIIDLEKEFKINKNEFISLGKNTPFHNDVSQGEVLYTLVNGEVVYKKI